MRDFLVSRRARITPEQAGLPAYGGNRRVAGLRREEVALLAGVSIDYYTRLERGRAAGASDSVLEGIARALQLDEAERAHLFDLARAAAPAAPRAPRRPAPQQVRPSVRRILDSMTADPRLRPQRPAGRPGRQPARRGAVRAGPQQPGPAGQQRPVPVPRPRRPRVLPRLGTPGPGRGRHAAHRGRAATRTTRACRTSSASCPPAARTSAPGGPRTTSGSTAPASSGSATPSSATSPSPTRPSTSPPMPACGSPPTPPSPAPPPTTPSSSLPPGPPPSTRPRRRQRTAGKLRRAFPPPGNQPVAAPLRAHP